MVGDAAVEGRQAGDPAEPRAPARIIDGEAVLGQLAVGQRRDPGRPVLAGLDVRACAARHAPALKPISGRAMASRFTTSTQARIFAALASAGTCAAPAPCANRSSTVTRVPGGNAAGPSPASRRCRPSATSRRRRAPGFRSSAARRWRSTAAPRRESPGSRPASIASSGSFEVACRSSASAISSGAMPQPSSATSIRPIPPCARADGDPRRAGVDRVFDQLLQRTGRSFHHFTGGDAVDQMLGQAAY